MKNKIYQISFLVLLSACSNNSNSSSKAAESGPKAMDQFAVKTGGYRMIADCLDAGRNQELALLEKSIFFEEDGIYTEFSKKIDPNCNEQCDLVMTGSYDINASTLTLNQKNIYDDNLDRFVNSAKTLNFQFTSYDKQKDQIALSSDQADNICNGKLVLVLSKQ